MHITIKLCHYVLMQININIIVLSLQVDEEYR